MNVELNIVTAGVGLAQKLAPLVREIEQLAVSVPVVQVRQLLHDLGVERRSKAVCLVDLAEPPHRLELDRAHVPRPGPEELPVIGENEVNLRVHMRVPSRGASQTGVILCTWVFNNSA